MNHEASPKLAHLEESELPIDSFGYIDNTDHETQVQELFAYHAGMTAVEYSQQYTEHWSRYRGVRQKVILRVANDAVKNLVEVSSSEELSAAIDIFIAKGEDLRDQAGEYLSWVNGIRRLANYGSPLYDPNQFLRDRGYAAHSEDPTEKINSSEIFWQKVYKGTIREGGAGLAFGTYVFGPGIERKDSCVLSETVERLHDEPIEEIFIGSGFIDTKNPVKLVRTIYDSFRVLVKEAAEAGWSNAVAIDRLFESYPKRDAPHQVLIIQAGNNVAAILQKHGIAPQSMNLEKLSNRRPAHLAESIQRCLYLIFETGKQPTGHDPLNYLLVGELLKAASERAAKLDTPKAV